MPRRRALCPLVIALLCFGCSSDSTVATPDADAALGDITAPVCGDRIVNGSEQCDGAALDGATCASQGFDGGELSCDGDCRFDTSGCVKHDWITVKAGTFTMGSPASEPGRGVNETAHQVTLTHDFQIASTEVTQTQYEKVRRYNPAAKRDAPCDGGDCPVETVSWSEAAAYCNALSEAQKLSPCYRCEAAGKPVRCSVSPSYLGAAFYDCPGYRLPTDAEWELAYRAGTSTPFYDSLSADEIGWHNNNSGGSPHPAAQKKPNNLGLHDMGGNVWEWCNDRFEQDLGSAPVTDPTGSTSSEYHVTRGGSWRFEPTRLRGASRLLNLPTKRQDDTGFRCVRSVVP
ncbi:MAG: SUMF1/EgtB/PvdO family nonheme iron enzyme [Myxococcales bacterium]|nr:SUMF1/EgtB/PvdO family nonheme iron enzyme [Myxococcales bacterium]